MGVCCSTNNGGAVVTPASRPQAQQQTSSAQPNLLAQGRTVKAESSTEHAAAPAPAATSGTSTAKPVAKPVAPPAGTPQAALENSTFFGAFSGQDAFPGFNAEVMDASDLEPVMKHCLEKGYGGFCVCEGKAHFRSETAEQCVRNLVDKAGATFYVSPHSSGRSFTSVKAMTYNLFWWNLYGQRDGNGASASHLLASARPDVAGFQECDDVTRVLREGGLEGEYRWIQGPHSIAMVYKASEWSELSQGAADVAVDEQQQFYGSRAVQWARLQHQPTGKVVFFMNHHGPLRVNTGGRSGGHQTALNILRQIQENKQPSDQLVLVGDFNASACSDTVRDLEYSLPRAFTGTSFGGVDHLFSTLQASSRQNHGAGGSDHDALSATFIL